MSKKIILSKTEKAYIERNYLEKSTKKISENLGYSFGVIRKYMKENNLIAPREAVLKFRSNTMSGRTNFTSLEDTYIKENYKTTPIKAMGRKLGRSYTGVKLALNRLGLVIPQHVANSRKEANQFKKGMEPKNKGKKQAEYMSSEALERTKKTRYKKGNIPHNTNYNGHERITKDGYIEIRVKKGEYQLKHKYLWELKNGKVPKSMCLRCVDGNKKNTNPNNWKLITLAKNMTLNSLHSLTPGMQRIVKLKNKLNNKIKTEKA